jgi:hypothetical protein
MANKLALADALGLISHAGTVIAVATAIIAGIAFCLGEASHGAVATAGWLIGVTLSLCAIFSGNWLLIAISLTALPAALLLTGGWLLLRATLPVWPPGLRR